MHGYRRQYVPIQIQAQRRVVYAAVNIRDMYRQILSRFLF